MSEALGHSRELGERAGAVKAPVFHTITGADWKQAIERARKEPNEIVQAIHALIEERREFARQADELAEVVGEPGLTGIPLRVAIKEFGKGKENEAELLKAGTEHRAAIGRAVGLGRSVSPGRSVGRGGR